MEQLNDPANECGFQCAVRLRKGNQRPTMPHYAQSTIAVGKLPFFQIFPASKGSTTSEFWMTKRWTFAGRRHYVPGHHSPTVQTSRAQSLIVIAHVQKLAGPRVAGEVPRGERNAISTGKKRNHVGFPPGSMGHFKNFHAYSFKRFDDRNISQFRRVEDLSSTVHATGITETQPLS